MKTRCNDLRRTRNRVGTSFNSIAPMAGLSLGATAAWALPECEDVWRPSFRGRGTMTMNARKWFALGSVSLAGASAAFAQPDYAPAHWTPPSCTKWYTSGNGHHFCVIHDMEGYYYSSISYLNRCDTSAGGHFNVGASVYYLAHSDYDTTEGAPVGDITQSVRESNYAWHVSCWNLWMFGTEHEGFSSSGNLWYTEAMYQSSAALQKHLCSTYGIPIDRNHIIGHNEWQNSAWKSWMAANYPSIDTSCNTHTDPGAYWNWSHFMALINGAVANASVVSSSVPSGVVTGNTFTATITLNNNGTIAWTNNSANAYKLGSQNAQDNKTWGFNRVALPSSPINAGANATFTFTATAPMTPGSYAFSWRMLQEGVQWFGDTFTTYVNVVLPGPGTNYGSYTINTGNMDSTSRDGAYSSYSTCGLNGWYSYGIPESGSNCTVFNRDIRWMPTLPTYGFTGRGFLAASMIVPQGYATATANFFAVDASGADLTGSITGSVNECAYTCAWVTFYSNSVNVTSLGGFRSNTQNDGPPSGGCSTACGTFPVGYSQMNIQAARWQYIDDWTCLGYYASTNVSDTSNRSFNETNLYLYPAVDTSHGNAITAALGFNGNTPGRVTTGDCNNATTLNFAGSVNGVSPAGNAAAYGNTNYADAYGFAWLFAPAGAGPQIVIGSDDGNRLWVNGVLKNDNNASRGLTRDKDNTGAVSLPAGWSRVLFKVHNFTAGWQGTVSLRNGSNVNLNEPSVNYYDLGGYYSYGLGYEQDAWYPQIAVSAVCGVSNPTNGAVFYGNNTTVTANGASNGQGPVPYWRTMQYQWGYGIAGDSNYADVSGSPTSASWSHSQTGVTGHRRLHLFAVSQSGRTSFQNSGVSGGSVFQDAGNYARYYDVYVDNVAPVPPSFSNSTPGTNQITLTWAIPLDQGVNIANSATEASAGITSGGANGYVRGDVAVQVYRNGSVISSTGEGGTWVTATAMSDTGLAANTAYNYTIEARDNNSSGRGVWNNSTGQTGTNTVWTLSVAPVAGSITPDNASPAYGSTNTWTVVNGFGAGKVQYYRYAWDKSATHTWADTEPQWLSGTLATVPTSAGTWYLHVKGYNGANVGNGTYDYSVTVNPKALTVTGITASNKAYDGNTTATLNTGGAALVGKIGSDNVTLNTAGAMGAFADANVGTGKTVTISGLSLTGGDAGNYSLTPPTASANITGASTTTILTSSANPSGPGTNVTFTATVSAVPPTTGAPMGDVVFLANDVPFSTNGLVGGSVGASITSLPLGTNTVLAQYAAQGNYLSSTGSVQQVVQSAVVYSQTNIVASIVDNGDGTFTLNFIGTPQAQYYVVTSTDPWTLMPGWAILPNSTNTAPSPSGVWSVAVTNDTLQRFYRSAAVNPAP